MMAITGYPGYKFGVAAQDPEIRLRAVARAAEQDAAQTVSVKVVSPGEP
jgi:hypothetical protein